VNRLDRTGHDVLKHQTATGEQHPVDFAKEACLIGNVHGDVLHPHGIEAFGDEGHGQRIALPKGDLIAEPKLMGEQRADPTVGFCHVEHRDVTADATRHQTRWATESPTDVEDLHVSAEPGKVQQRACRLLSTGMKVIDRREV
jgi:hypothetical protein